MHTQYRNVILSLGVLVALVVSACGALQTGSVRENQAAVSDQAGILGTLEIHGYDFGGYSPAAIRVAEPGRYSITFVNKGTIEHDITFPGGIRLVTQPGEAKSSVINVPATGLNFM